MPKYQTRKRGNRKTRKVSKGSKVSNDSKKTASYLIIDNGLKPFCVTVYDKTVEICAGDQVEGDDYDEHRNYNKLIKKLTVEKIYPGEAPSDPTMFLNSYSTYDKGNSVLLHVSANNYIFVGKNIYEFTMEGGEEVDAYYSPIGSNAVPYPVIIGSKNVYFMLDRIYIPKEAFTGLHTESEWADAYAYYHGLKDIKTGAVRDNIKKMPGSFKMKGIKLLHK